MLPFTSSRLARRMRVESVPMEPSASAGKTIRPLPQLPPEEAIPKIGEAWVGEEALGIAVYCALIASDLEHGIRLSVNHSGDSDTTGILVGQLLGAQYGETAIPQCWLEPLELREEIGRMADDLYHHREWNLDELDYDEDIVKRYPGG